MKIFVLKTGFFAKEAVLEQAIACLEAEHQVDWHDATRPNIEDHDWDTAVKKLVAADRVITI